MISKSAHDSWNAPDGESAGDGAMWMPITLSEVLVWFTTSYGPLPVAMIGAL